MATQTERLEIEVELAMIHQRRTLVTDLLIRSLIEIDTLANRIDVLLDRKLALQCDA